MAAFLDRNRGLSKVTVIDNSVIGTLLCGHDGRRGYLYHLLVDRRFRRNGIGKQMVELCLDDLGELEIQKCHLFIFTRNRDGKEFWKASGWDRRADIEVFSKGL